jgi:hypothetical protein
MYLPISRVLWIFQSSGRSRLVTSLPFSRKAAKA